MLVAPTMYQSFSGGDLPGTINITPATMAHVVSDMLVSLAAQGFRNFHLFLCHGGSENSRASKGTAVPLRLTSITTPSRSSSNVGPSPAPTEVSGRVRM